MVGDDLKVKRIVFDTSAFIFFNKFDEFETIYTVPEVLDEIKDKISSVKLLVPNLKVFEPSKESLEKVKKTASTTGDLSKLSNTDLKVLALAYEKKVPIMSDDRNVQNVAYMLGLDVVSVFSKKIERLFVWKKYCRNCNKFYPGDVDECPVCGSKLIRIVWRKKLLDHQNENKKDTAR